MDDMSLYVVGFLFQDKTYSSPVTLIEKNRPDWQAGMLNGVGGKIEADESALDAMEREFREETGVETKGAWRQFLQMDFPEAKLYFYVGAMTHRPVSLTDEPVGVYTPAEIMVSGHRLIENLHWIIPLARYALIHPEAWALVGHRNSFTRLKAQVPEDTLERARKAVQRSRKKSYVLETES